MQRIKIKKYEDGKFPKVYVEGDKYYWNIDPANPFLRDTLKGSDGKSFDVETTVKSIASKNGGRGFSVTVIMSAVEPDDTPSSPPTPSTAVQPTPPLRSKEHMGSGTSGDMPLLYAALAASSLSSGYACAMADNGNFQGLSPGDIESRVFDYWQRSFQKIKEFTGAI